MGGVCNQQWIQSSDGANLLNLVVLISHGNASPFLFSLFLSVCHSVCLRICLIIHPHPSLSGIISYLCIGMVSHPVAEGITTTLVNCIYSRN